MPQTDPRIQERSTSVPWRGWRAEYGSGGPLATYMVAMLPRWILTVITSWILNTWFDVPIWAAAGLVTTWVVMDLASYPRLRRYYESDPADRRIIGETGFAVTDLAPSGFARVHGELWQAESENREVTIAVGSGLRVRDVRGLVLLVSPAPDYPSRTRAHPAG